MKAKKIRGIFKRHKLRILNYRELKYNVLRKKKGDVLAIIYPMASIVHYATIRKLHKDLKKIQVRVQSIASAYDDKNLLINIKL